MIPSVDILIPIYRVEAHIERCLRSVLAQNYPNTRIVIVEDHSPDKSLALAKNILEQENPRQHRVEILSRQENGGIGIVRAELLARVESNYLLFIDSDDYWDNPDTLSEWIAIAEKGHYSVVVADYFREEGKSGQKKMIRLPKGGNGKAHAYEMLKGSEPAYLWNKLFRREALLPWREVLQKGRDIWEDLALVVPAMYHAERVGYYPKPAYHYVQHGVGQYTSRVRPSYIDIFASIDADLSKILPSDEDEMLARCLNSFKIRRCLVLYKLPWRYYGRIRKSGFKVQQGYLPPGKRERLKYCLFRLLQTPISTPFGYTLLRIAQGLNRIRRKI